VHEQGYRLPSGELLVATCTDLGYTESPHSFDLCFEVRRVDAAGQPLAPVDGATPTRLVSHVVGIHLARLADGEDVAPIVAEHLDYAAEAMANRLAADAVLKRIPRGAKKA
jgi:hypothetical protein